MNNHLTDTIAAVTEEWKQRQAWHRAEKSLTLAIKSQCRRLCDGDKARADVLYATLLALPEAEAVTAKRKTKQKNTAGDFPPILLDVASTAILPLVQARNQIEPKRKIAEKNLTLLARDLPGFTFCLNTPGLSAFTIYALVAEAPGRNHRGFLDFPRWQQLWKRLGVGLVDGKRQRKVKDKQLAKQHGYSPARRSVLWTIGDSLVKKEGYYRDLYLRFKLDEQEKARAQGLKIAPAAKIPKKKVEQYRSEGHIHNRAKRRVEKKLVKDLWRLARAEAARGEENQVA